MGTTTSPSSLAPPNAFEYRPSPSPIQTTEKQFLSPPKRPWQDSLQGTYSTVRGIRQDLGALRPGIKDLSTAGPWTLGLGTWRAYKNCISHVFFKAWSFYFFSGCSGFFQVRILLPFAFHSFRRSARRYYYGRYIYSCYLQYGACSESTV